MSRLLAVSLACISIASNAAAQATFHAREGAAGGDGSCALPFGNVSEALAAARASGGPSRILIAGSFRETGLVADVAGLRIEGGFDGASMSAGCDAASIDAARDVLLFPTVLDGDTDGDGLGDGRILDVVDAGDDLVLDGLTFLRGRAGGAAGPLAPREGSGGAVRIVNAQRVIVTNCTFRSNRTTQNQAGGGAIFVGAEPGPGGAGAASLALRDSVFELNAAGDGTTSAGSGGALAAWDFNGIGGFPPATFVEATGNTFNSNLARGSGPLDAAVWCTGWSGTSPPAPNVDCAPRDGTFDRCTSRAVGGAVSLADAGGAWDGNLFDSNVAAGPATGASDGTGQGGAFSSYSSQSAPAGPQPVITNNVFRFNAAVAGAGSAAACGAAAGWGGAAYLANFGSRLSGNVFEENLADGTRQVNTSLRVGDGGAVAIVGQGTCLIEDNRFFGNQALGGQGTTQSGAGGAIFFLEGLSTAAPVVSNNVIEANLAWGGGSYTGYGGGVFVSTAADSLIARNRIEANEARAPEQLFAGIGGAAWIQAPGGLVADNVITGNLGTNVATTGEFRFGGLSFLTAAGGDPARAPRVQNNLITGNQGAAISAAGFPIDINGDGTISQPQELFFCSPEIRQNTVTGNTGPALATNLSSFMLADGNVLSGNDVAGTGAGDWFDGFLGTASTDVVVSHSLLSTWSASVDATVRDPANANLLGDDPSFVDEATGDFHLRQRPDQPSGTVSPLVDAGGALAETLDYGPALFDQRLDGVPTPYDGDGLPGADTMASGTTRSVTQLADDGPCDIGYHYPPAPVGDSDGDGLRDDDESLAGLDPFDPDSDDDGLRDGDELLSDSDSDGKIDALDCDADDDGLVDGMESGVLAPDPFTDVAATCAGTGTLSFVADGDGSTRTNPIVADTDGDGCLDGEEDSNGNGIRDPGESDPLDPAGCAPPVLLRINESVASLSGGLPGACGPSTVPPLSGQLDASGTCVAWTSCATPSVDPTRTLPWIGPSLTLAGEADPRRWKMIFYEIDGCPGTLHVAREGSDIVISTR